MYIRADALKNGSVDGPVSVYTYVCEEGGGTARGGRTTEMNATKNRKLRKANCSLACHGPGGLDLKELNL